MTKISNCRMPSWTFPRCYHILKEWLPASSIMGHHFVTQIGIAMNMYHSTVQSLCLQLVYIRVKTKGFIKTVDGKVLILLVKLLQKWKCEIQRGLKTLWFPSQIGSQLMKLFIGCLYLLEWNVEWNGGMENGMERWMYILTANSCNCCCFSRLS